MTLPHGIAEASLKYYLKDESVALLFEWIFLNLLLEEWTKSWPP